MLEASPDDVARLLVFIDECYEPGLLMAGALREKILVVPMRAHGDHGIGRLKDRLYAAIILLQLQHRGRWIRVWKTEDVVDGGGTERIDALRIVPHHSEAV